MHSISEVSVTVAVFTLLWIVRDCCLCCSVSEVIATHVLYHDFTVIILISAWMLICPKNWENICLDYCSTTTPSTPCALPSHCTWKTTLLLVIRKGNSELSSLVAMGMHRLHIHMRVLTIFAVSSTGRCIFVPLLTLRSQCKWSKQQLHKEYSNRDRNGWVIGVAATCTIMRSWKTQYDKIYEQNRSRSTLTLLALWHIYRN